MNQIECNRESKVKASLDRETLHLLREGKLQNLNDHMARFSVFEEHGNMVLQVYTDDGHKSGWLVAQFVIKELDLGV